MVSCFSENPSGRHGVMAVPNHPEAMAHRNRWFTVLKNGWIFHGYVSQC